MNMFAKNRFLPTAKNFFSQKILLKVAMLLFLFSFLALSFAAVYFAEIRGFFSFISQRYPQLEFVEKIPKILNIPYSLYFLVPDKIPTYELIVDEWDLKKINNALPSLELVGDLYTIPGRLEKENRENAKAIFITENQEYKVEISPRGDLPEHWRDKKMSWRIKFKNDNLFNGKKSINLIIPSARWYILEEFNNYRAKKLGLFVPDSRFVNLSINGKQMGVYWEVEQWGEEMLERAGLRSDTNLYGENDMFLTDDKIHSIYSSVIYWKKYTKNKIERTKNYDDLDRMLSLLNDSHEDYFKRNIGAILDLNNFFSWQAHSALSNSLHQDNIHNVRLYFDIETGKFKFIPWDVLNYDGGMYGHERKLIDFYYNDLAARILKDDEFRFQRDLILWDYVKDEDVLREDLIFYDQLFNSVKPSFFKYWEDESSILKINREIKSHRNTIEQRFYNVRNALKNSFVNAKMDLTNAVRQNLLRLTIIVDGHSAVVWNDIELSGIEGNASAMYLFQDINNNGIIDLTDRRISARFNDIEGDINIEEIEETLNSIHDWDGANYYEGVDVLPAMYNYLIYSPAPLFIDNDKFKVKLNFINKITGGKIDANVKYSYFDKFSDIDFGIDRNSFVKSNNIFAAGNKDEEIKITSGTHVVNQTIVIPPQFKLIIEPGTILRMSPGASIISYAPVMAIGTDISSINITTAIPGQKWGTFTVINGDKSFFSNINFSWGGESYENGVLSTGMLSIHGGSVIIENNKFRFAGGDDALNIKRAKIEVRGNVFSENLFDAFDADFDTGVIENNKFFNNGNDGIDVGGGSGILIKNNWIEGGGDKCISIGEGAQDITIVNNLNKNCLIGIAAKDSSDVLAINNLIIENKTGLSVYEKKPIFGGALLKIANSIIWFNEKNIEIDEKSKIFISYSDIEGGYDGDGNLNQKPIFRDAVSGDYLLRDGQESLPLIEGGNLDAINFIINGSVTAPIGLIHPLI